MDLDFVSDIPYITYIAAGEYHSLVATKNGKLYTFGYNQSGQLGHNNTENYCKPKLVESMKEHKIIQVAGGRLHSLILDSKNDVYGCGNG